MHVFRVCGGAVWQVFCRREGILCVPKPRIYDSAPPKRTKSYRNHYRGTHKMRALHVEFLVSTNLLYPL